MDHSCTLYNETLLYSLGPKAQKNGCIAFAFSWVILIATSSHSSSSFWDHGVSYSLLGNWWSISDHLPNFIIVGLNEQLHYNPSIGVVFPIEEWRSHVWIVFSQHGSIMLICHQTPLLHCKDFLMMIFHCCISWASLGSFSLNGTIIYKELALIPLILIDIHQKGGELVFDNFKEKGSRKMQMIDSGSTSNA